MRRRRYREALLNGEANGPLPKSGTPVRSKLTVRNGDLTGPLLVPGTAAPGPAPPSAGCAWRCHCESCAESMPGAPAGPFFWCCDTASSASPSEMPDRMVAAWQGQYRAKLAGGQQRHICRQAAGPAGSHARQRHRPSVAAACDSALCWHLAAWRPRPAQQLRGASEACWLARRRPWPCATPPRRACVVWERKVGALARSCSRCTSCLAVGRRAGSMFKHSSMMSEAAWAGVTGVARQRWVRWLGHKGMLASADHAGHILGGTRLAPLRRACARGWALPQCISPRARCRSCRWREQGVGTVASTDTRHARACDARGLPSSRSHL